uniref:Uncharacterized protein n=1 Tax=Sphaerodactylus townsendi TaxID=933632 RepID=A0ACB8FE41_9SAUR
MYSSVPKNSKYLEFQEFADSLSSRTFDHPPLIKGDFPGLNEYVHRNYQLLLGKPLDTLSDNMMTNLQSIFKRQFSQVTDWKVGKLYKFCSSVMFEGSFITLHGRDPSANSHNIIGAIEEKFTKFDARFSYLAANIPIELLGGTKRIRKELIDIFLPTSTAKWEGVSEIIEGRKEMFEAFEGLRDYDKAAHHFAFMWASVGNTIPATFWAVYYLLRHPEALAVVRDEIDHLLQSTGQERGPGCHIHITREQLDNLVYLEHGGITYVSYHFNTGRSMALSASFCLGWRQPTSGVWTFPLYRVKFLLPEHCQLKSIVSESALNESFRICSASMNIRIVKEDFIFKLEGNQEVRLRKDDWVAIYPPILHMDPEVYQDPKMTFLGACRSTKIHGLKRKNMVMRRTAIPLRAFDNCTVDYHKLEAKCRLCLEVDHWMPKEG